MRVALHVLCAIVGVAIIAGTLASALRSTVLPRSAHRGLSRVSLRVTRFLFRLWAGEWASYERRDAVMAMLGPVSLILLLATWLVLTLFGFALVYVAAGVGTIAGVIELSGSSVFTLGTTKAGNVPTDLITYVEAGLGLLLVTLLITYLPSIYGAFSRRENGVNLLRVRAGDPPRAATLLIRYHRIDKDRTRLGDLWQTWEAWFTDVEETHTTFAVLPFFRSPQPQQSWITAAGALLDAASLWAAAVEHAADPDAQLCIRTGFQTLRRIAQMFGIDFDDDPGADDPISVSRSEWDEAVNEMAAAGLPVSADRDAAWQAWRGWRVNYDTVLLSLARIVEAPLAPWVSDRSPIWMGPMGGRRVGKAAKGRATKWRTWQSKGPKVTHKTAKGERSAQPKSASRTERGGEPKAPQKPEEGART